MSKHDDGCSGGCDGCIALGALGAAQERDACAKSMRSALACLLEGEPTTAMRVLTDAIRALDEPCRTCGGSTRVDAGDDVLGGTAYVPCHDCAPKPDARELALKAVLRLRHIVEYVRPHGYVEALAEFDAALAALEGK